MVAAHECNKEKVITEVYSNIATLKERSENQGKKINDICESQNDMAKDIKSINTVLSELKGGLKFGRVAFGLSVAAFGAVGWLIKIVYDFIRSGG